MNRATQIQRILNYCEQNGSITKKEAENALGIGNFGARMSNIRRITDEDGLFKYSVHGVWENGKNRYGEPTRYMRYTINGK